MKRGIRLIGVDVGTSKVCAVVASPENETLGLAVVAMPGWPERPPSSAELAGAIAKAVSEAHAMARKPSARRVWLAIGGTGIKYTIARGIVGIKAQDERVKQGDMERAIGASVLPGGKAIHRLLVSTVLDGVEMLEDPSGRKGRRLEANVLAVEAEPWRDDELRRAVALAGLECQGFIAGTLAAASVLASAEKEIGTAILDCGAVHTSVVVYARGAPRHLATVSLGGMHITRDLAVATGLPIARAEMLKIETQHAGKETGAIETLAGRVMAARIGEILEKVQAELARAGWAGRIPGGYVLTGGGALLANMRALAERAFSGSVRLGLPSLGQTDGMIAGPAFATLLGLAEAVRGFGNHLPKGGGRWSSRSPRRNLPA